MQSYDEMRKPTFVKFGILSSGMKTTWFCYVNVGQRQCREYETQANTVYTVYTET
jgi:hypothetical protein